MKAVHKKYLVVVKSYDHLLLGIQTTQALVSNSNSFIHCLTIRCDFQGLAHKHTEFGVYIS
jgi:hypothetical protein